MMNGTSNINLSIAPLERLNLPVHLDGSQVTRSLMGTEYPCLDVRNDLEAIERWLADVSGCAATYDRYRLEAERCLLWTTVERGKPLRTLDQDDALAYRQFLLNLEPRERWICVGRPRREDTSWRPFQRPMSPRTLEGALRILFGLWDWFEAHGYVADNPWKRMTDLAGKADKAIFAPAISTGAYENINTAVEWAYLNRALNEIAEREGEPGSSRLLALFYLAYFADIKPGELAALGTSAVTVIANTPEPVWTVTVAGRSPERSEVVLLPPAQQALGRYLDARGVAFAMSAIQENLPLIVSSRTSTRARPTSRQALHTIAKPVFELAASMAQRDRDAVAACRLSHASLQWLCHAFEVHATNQGVIGGWTWLLLGSQYLAPAALRSFLPGRTRLPIREIVRGFDQLESVWRSAVG